MTPSVMVAAMIPPQPPLLVRLARKADGYHGIALFEGREGSEAGIRAWDVAREFQDRQILALIVLADGGVNKTLGIRVQKNANLTTLLGA